MNILLDIMKRVISSSMLADRFTADRFNIQQRLSVQRINDFVFKHAA